MKSIPSLTICAVIALASAGCVPVHESVHSSVETVATGHPGGAYTPRNATIFDLENKEVFVLMDKATEHSVTTSGLQQGVKEDGRLEVKANIRNRESRRIQVQVSCVFKDEQGFSTNDETPWENLILTENAQETVSFLSMNNKARRYTVRVRQAR
jgi:uncharacterized protein YcfL